MDSIYEKKYFKYKKKYLNLKQYITRGGDPPSAPASRIKRRRGPKLSLQLDTIQSDEAERDTKQSKLFKDLLDTYQAEMFKMSDTSWDILLSDLGKLKIHLGEVDHSFEDKPPGFELSSNQGANGQVYINTDKELFLKKIIIKDERARILKSSEEELKKQIKNIMKLTNSGCRTVPLNKLIIGYNKIMKQYIVWTLMPICEPYSTEKLDTIEKKYEFLKQIKKGIKALHSLDLVHRDLKLKNIVLCNNCSENKDDGLFPGNWVIIDLDGLLSQGDISDNSSLDNVGRTVGYWFKFDSSDSTKEKHFNFLKRLDWYAYGIIACQVFGLIDYKSHNDIFTCMLHGFACFIKNYSENYAQTINCIMNVSDEKINNISINIDHFKKTISSLLFRNDADFQNSLFKFGDRFWNDNYTLTQFGIIWRNADF
jgi:serine/threonine protein kinase